MLELLINYARKHMPKAPEPGFSAKDVRWAIDCDAQGNFLDVIELGDTSQKRNRGQLFPKCPKGSDNVIAHHACQKYSGRVGRTKAAKDLSEGAVRMAVIAHIRHTETNYGELMGKGYERFEARQMVKSEVDTVLLKWEG